MNRCIIVLICILLIAALSYAYWSFSNILPSDLRPVATETVGVSVYGVDRGHGNLLAAQPWMSPMDYAREDLFYLALDRCLAEAERGGHLNNKTIVVFPEYIGTWLVAANERRPVYSAVNLTDAMISLVFGHPFQFGKTMLSAGKNAKDSVKYSLFKMKSAQMAQIYDSVFSKLARNYHVTIVAGSIILPSPSIYNGHLVVGAGKLQNITAIYQPNGQADAILTKKIYLTADEQEFATGAHTGGPEVYSTSTGKLGVMICADSWFPQAYPNLKTGGAQFVVAPSFFSPDGFTRPWPGYNGAPNPTDVNPRDLGRLTEQDAWLKYALPGRIASSGARFGMINYFRGKIWDMASNGYVLVVDDGRVTKIKNESKHTIVNAWLP